MADFASSFAAPAAPDHAAALLALRRRAEQRRYLVTQPSEGHSPDELQRLVQELQVHQIELEMQYEELLLAQTEVQRARAQYADLYDFAPVGYLTLDAGGVMEQLNLSASRLLGTSRQRLEGRRFALFVAPADRGAFHQFLTLAQAAEHSLSCELQLLRDDGTPFFAQLEALRASGGVGSGPAGAGEGAAPYPPAPAQVRLALLDISARRRATDELASSAARFRTLFEQSPDGMLLIENGHIVDANAALVRLFGLLDAGQVRGRPLGTFSPELQPDGRRSAAGLRAHLAAAQRQGWSRFEWYRQTAAGQDQWLEMTAAPVAVGSQPLMQLSVRDITAQRAAQEALQASERRQQLALDATESGVWRRELPTGVFHADARTWLLLGQPALPAARPFSEVEACLHPADQVLLTAATEQALARDEPVEVELRVLLPDGGLRYLHVTGRLDPDERGGPPSASLTGLARDVTARRLAEEELDYKNRLLDHLVHNLPVILSQLTPEGRYLELTGLGLRRLGIADNALVGTPVEAVFPALAPTIHQLLAGRPLNFVSSGQYDDQPVHYQHYGFFDEQQQRAVMFSIDVTEREQLREESLRQQRQQQQQVLAATLDAQEAERRRIAESLHNGLGQLLYATKLTLSGAPADGESTQRARRLLDEAIRATRTISFELTPGVLNDFGLAVALQELAKRLPREPLPLRLDLTGLGGGGRLPPPVEIAAYRIAQELINNVIKHAQATEATLRVRLDASPPARLRLRLLMHDNGRGFDVAGQAEAGAASGLGLRSIRHRVELLGGHLELDSQPGQGTRVAVELPVRS